MDYFLLKTDERCQNLPQLQLPKELSPTRITKKSIQKLGTASMIYVKENIGMDTVYPDYFEKPLPLIADKFQRILQKYQPDMILHRVMLIEKKSGAQKAYHLMLPPEIACVHEQAAGMDAAGNIQEFVLDVEKVGTQKIFLAKDYGRQLLVRLDVAESILRREPNGIWFEPVKMAGRST